ncbi:MAG: hypothetical protein HOE46_02175 [Candidatus Marinimicrobia bacterium]|nr:hypothetical protein [Candidatus Neomarinimicrobiota bacterium]MBT5406005.1 hypothetical protein [Gammaproteobacteria bacterium]MBT7423652.1 hypothetical protein [Candidatus Neomarinimicrobiota bacterium]
MRKKILILLFSFTALFSQVGETWTVGESVYQISTIDLEPNVDPQYLNQMKKTWGNNMEVMLAEGLIEEYHIFRSINQYDGDFDLLLMIKYKNLAILDSNPKNNKKREKAQAKAREVISRDKTNQITGTFPKMRTILDQKLMREITFKK